MSYDKFVLERVTSPEIEPITLGELKLHLRYDADVTAEDQLLESLISAGREWIENYTGRALVDQTWRLTLINHDGSEIPLRRAPVLSIESVNSVDSDGVETEITEFELLEKDSKWPRLKGVAAGHIRVVYRAGFVDRSVSPQEGIDLIPVSFKQSIKLWVEANYDRDATMMPLLLATAEIIIKPERSNLQLA